MSQIRETDGSTGESGEILATVTLPFLSNNSPNAPETGVTEPMMRSASDKTKQRSTEPITPRTTPVTIQRRRCNFSGRCPECETFIFPSLRTEPLDKHRRLGRSAIDVALPVPLE